MAARLQFNRDVMIENISSMDRVVEERGRSRRIPIVIAAVVLLVVFVVTLPAATRWFRAERSVDASSLRYATVTRGDLVRDLTVQGRVVAALSPTLFSTGPGIVTLTSRPGADVRQGEILATIDSKELQAALDQANAQLLSMRADLSRQRIEGRQSHLRAMQLVELHTLRHAAAQRQLERVSLLAKEGLTNQTELETAQDNVRIVAMELDQARSERTLSGETAGFESATVEQQLRRQESVVAELEKRVESLALRAPFDGQVAAYSVADSDAVAASQPIVQVVNLSSLEIEIALPEAYGNETPLGTSAVVSFQGRDYPGHVTSVAPEVVNSQVLARVTFEGGRPEGLRQNQRLTTRLTFESKHDVLKVTRGAFVDAGGGRAAWVVDGKMATRREIETGAFSAGEIEIRQGLSEGEVIVVSDTAPFGDAKTVMLR
ncbi:MAG TPA: HlyD family efflux transporter periplasmic adaptor subunit [Thermoanaerobaculia bacterium]